jgi:hypothetical protein
MAKKKGPIDIKSIKDSNRKKKNMMDSIDDYSSKNELDQINENMEYEKDTPNVRRIFEA